MKRMAVTSHRANAVKWTILSMTHHSDFIQMRTLRTAELRVKIQMFTHECDPLNTAHQSAAMRRSVHLLWFPIPVS
jgi:hypothetical protein